MVNLRKQWQFYLPGVLVTTMGLIILFVWEVTFFNFLSGILIFGSGAYLCFLVHQQEQEKRKTRLIEEERATEEGDRAIHTQGGSYNESIQGDCITIQGNKIYFNQDLSHFTAQIQGVLSQLQRSGFSYEVAEQRVTSDLKACVRRSAKVRRELLRWRRNLANNGAKSLNATETVERIVMSASEESSSSFYETTLVTEGRYQKLYDLLREGEWEAADEETVKIIFNLMPGQHYRYLDIKQVPPKDLKRLNQLWVNCSNGRFGFSIQQSIWKKVLKVYNHHEFLMDEDEYWADEAAYVAFTDCVGWPRENDRIYHGDFKYSLEAPKGHLPAIIMLDFSYHSPSNYYHLNGEVFNVLMTREYNSTPHAPSWLKQWLSVE